jgi:hypothetical protein
MDSDLALRVVVGGIVGVHSDIGIGFAAVRANPIIDSLAQELAVAAEACSPGFLFSPAFSHVTNLLFYFQGDKRPLSYHGLEHYIIKKFQKKELFQQIWQIMLGKLQSSHENACFFT